MTQNSSYRKYVVFNIIYYTVPPTCYYFGTILTENEYVITFTKQILEEVQTDPTAATLRLQTVTSTVMDTLG